LDGDSLDRGIQRLDKKWDKVLDDSNKPFYRWFTGGAAQHLLQCPGFPRRKRRGDQAA
jgi:propionyl-CoA synthetase